MIWLVLGTSICAFAQVDTGRDLSKYADDKFREDDKYHVDKILLCWRHHL